MCPQAHLSCLPLIHLWRSLFSQIIWNALTWILCLFPFLLPSFFLYSGKDSHCSPCWPRACSNPPVSASSVLRFQVWPRIMPAFLPSPHGFIFVCIKLFFYSLTDSYMSTIILVIFTLPTNVGLFVGVAKCGGHRSTFGCFWLCCLR